MAILCCVAKKAASAAHCHSFYLFHINPNSLWWVHMGISLKERQITEEPIKGAQVSDFRPIFFYISKSYMGRWLEDWRKKKFCSKTTAEIRHFGFFVHAEPALKNCLRMLSMR